MPVYKISFIFSQTSGTAEDDLIRRPAGWSETWYFDGTEAQAEASADSWAKKRARILTSRGRVAGFRIQELGGKGRIVRFSYPGVLGSDQDIPQMALNCRVRATGLANVKYFQLRGLPDGIVVQGNFRPTAAFSAGFDQWIGYLGTASWRFRAVTSPVSPPQIVSIDATGNFVLGGPLTFNIGSFLQLVRAKNVSGGNISGKYYVESKIDDRRGKFAPWTGGVVSLSGTARVVGYGFPIVAAGSGEALLITTRRVGRPFDLYRGRRTRR